MESSLQSSRPLTHPLSSASLYGAQFLCRILRGPGARMVHTQAGTCPPGAQSTGSSGATVMGVLIAAMLGLCG